ncbi:hypothetical protein GCM10023210_00170 [Chryseobacterium ginsengisoli]|uniref:Tetratricopeptide repeat protein n=1 Tax=Chryseobacterium ginsengisoli TaxID=363853 RepID=A0ABP9LT48_9FLAO
MRTRKLFVGLLIAFSLTATAQSKINENKYNKFIKGEKYTEALTYLQEKGVANPDSYWFNKDVDQLLTFCFDPNFNDNEYNMIVSYANNSFKNMDYKDRSYYEMGGCYFVKTNHYLWKGDYEKAAQAYKESLEKLEKFKKENDLNPEGTKAIKSVIERLYLSETEAHKLVKTLRNFDVNNLNLSEEQAYAARQQIKGLLSSYDKPRKVYFITYQNYSTMNDGFAKEYFAIPDYFQNNFFYNMPKTVKDKYFPTINLLYLFNSDKYKTKEEETQQSEQRKAALIKKYGKNFGEAVFEKKIIIGMTKAMLEEGFNKPRSVDVSEYSEYWTWSDLMVTIDKKTQKVTNITNLR